MTRQTPIQTDQHWLFAPKPPACDECNGERYFTDADGSRACVCLKRYVSWKSLRRAQVPLKLQAATLNGWETPKAAHKAVKKALREWEASWRPQGKSGLLLWGVPGNGKSHVAVALLKRIVDQHNLTAGWQNVPLLFEQVRDAMNHEEAEQETEILERLTKVDLLVLDDLGASQGTGWQQDILYRLVDRREQNERPLIVTTNANPTDADVLVNNVPMLRLASVIDGRVVSRLRGMCQQIQFPERDWRAEAASK